MRARDSSVNSLEKAKYCQPGGGAVFWAGWKPTPRSYSFLSTAARNSKPSGETAIEIPDGIRFGARASNGGNAAAGPLAALEAASPRSTNLSILARRELLGTTAELRTVS